MCSRILLQTPRHVTGAGGCNLPLSHMSAPVTLLLASGVNVDAPTVAVHHTTDGPGVAHSSLASSSVVCVRKRLDRVLAPILAITQKEEEFQTRWRATEESHWRSDIVTDLHICRFCGVFCQTRPFFLSIPPASANRNAKYVCALVCAKGARLIVADKLSRLFFLY